VMPTLPTAARLALATATATTLQGGRAK